jgi:hypothetical protein
MKVKQPAYEPHDGALAGVLFIAVISLCVGILLGLLIAS